MEQRLENSWRNEGSELARKTRRTGRDKGRRRPDIDMVMGNKWIQSGWGRWSDWWERHKGKWHVTWNERREQVSKQNREPWDNIYTRLLSTTSFLGHDAYCIVFFQRLTTVTFFNILHIFELRKVQLNWEWDTLTYFVSNSTHTFDRHTNQLLN